MSRPRVILVADDDPADVYFLRQALSECLPEARVLDVADGQEALDYLAGTGRYADRVRFPLPDRVFLDVKMPRRSGLEVLAWLRARPEFRALAVTVLSGSELAGDMRSAGGLGAEYVVKPVEYSALREVVRRYARDA